MILVNLVNLVILAILVNDYTGKTGNPCKSGDAIDSGDFGDSGGYGDSGDSSGYCILDILELKNIACVGSFKHFVFVLVCVFVIVIVILFPMMRNMWVLTWFWGDLKAPEWKC